MSKPAVITAFETAVSFRTPLPVLAVRAFNFYSGSTTFPICPRCNSTMEREYQAYCDRCGQALDWKHFNKAVIIL